MFLANQASIIDMSVSWRPAMHEYFYEMSSLPNRHIEHAYTELIGLACA